MSNSKSDDASQGLYPSLVKLKCRWIIFVNKRKDDQKKQSWRIQATFIIKSWQSQHCHNLQKEGKQLKLSVSAAIRTNPNEISTLKFLIDSEGVEAHVTR